MNILEALKQPAPRWAHWLPLVPLIAVAIYMLIDKLWLR